MEGRNRAYRANQKCPSGVIGQVSAIICYMQGDRETQAPVEPTVPAAESNTPVDEITDVLRADTEDALAAARHKQQAASVRLAEAHDEAQSLISDATHQAMLVSRPPSSLPNSCWLKPGTRPRSWWLRPEPLPRRSAARPRNWCSRRTGGREPADQPGR